MTITQRSELDRAIERAMAAGLEIIGRGHLKASNERVFLVPSQSQPTRAHLVVLHGHRLVCDCAARVLCVHKAVVHMALIVEAAEREAHAAEITRQLELENHDAAESEQAAERTSRRHHEPRLATDTRAFSVFK
jgi:hypothetical protein